MEQKNSNQTGSKRTLIVVSLLLLVAIMTIGFFWKQNQSLSTSILELNDEVGALNELRMDLVYEVEDLALSFDEILMSNDSLEMLYEEMTETVDQQKATIKKIKKDFANDAVGMKAEIDQLKTIKKELASTIEQLKRENANLKMSNETLALQVANTDAANKELTFQVAELRMLNTDLEKDKKNLLAVSTRASDIRIDLRKKGDKTTGSARRTREIIASFNINHLPKDKEGIHDLYLVIKDAKGNVVKVENPIKATITPDAGGQAEEIIAQQVITNTLFESARLKFKVTPVHGSLHKGFYRAAVYTEWGLLGAAQFQLK